MNNKVALVLGGNTGLLGKSLVRCLQQKNWDVHTLGREDGDILQPDFLSNYIDKCSPNAIFNTIAWTQVDLAETHSNDALLINRTLPSLLGTILKGTSTHLIQFSTDFVFDGTKNVPYVEEDVPYPLSVYGSSKLAGEQAILQLKLENYSIIRTSWLFGPGRKNFIQTILELAKTKNFLHVVHDQIGSPTYTPDLAEASISLVENKGKGIFHIANSGQASWCDFAAEAIRQANLSCTIQGISTNEWGKNIAKRPAYSVLNCERYRQITGISIRPWPQALREYIFTYFLPMET